MTRKAVFPGSFDPVTLGHLHIIASGLRMFDEIIIAIGQNSTKQSYFPLEQRMSWLTDLCANEPRISVETYTGLTVQFCREHHASFILRGLRSAADFEYESVIAQTNRTLVPDVETVFILTDPQLAHISSTIVKEVLRHGGDISRMVPPLVVQATRK